MAYSDQLRNVELRQTLHDELAAIRVLNSTIRLAVDARDAAELVAARLDSLAVVRTVLAQLHPRIGQPPKKRPARAITRTPEGVSNESR